MKQVFGIFAALILMPTFQVQAWVGGPWSNNSYQSNGDDGIYEAVGTMTDGTALYRWAVQNEPTSGATLTDGARGTTGGGFLQTPGGSNSSNVQFGGLVGANSAHVIWYRGVVYYGRVFGTVNSGLNTVAAVGNATTTGGFNSTTNINGVAIQGPLPEAGIQGIANSAFRGTMTQKHPMKRFHGRGQVVFLGSGVGNDSSTSFPSPGHKVGLKVFGAQVSVQVNG